MIRFRDRPVRQKLMLAIVGTSALALFFASVAFTAYQWFTVRGATVDNVSAVMAIISSNSTAALTFNDAEAARQTLSGMKAKDLIQVACIYTRDEIGRIQVFASYTRDSVKRRCPASPLADSLDLIESRLTQSSPIMLDGEWLGTLYLERNLADIWEALLGYTLLMLLAMLISLLVAMGMSRLMQRFIASPLLNLSSSAGEVSRTKNYAIRVAEGNKDEVGQLINDFNDMLEQIDIRDHALESAKQELEQRVEEANAANEKLQKTLKRLRMTQEQLVQSEKMASLGGLVAGIAHEINTPVGVGVTAASTLKMKTEELSKNYEANQLTNSGLKNYVDLATQSSDIILTNLDRAAELIHSFKQVAVDQSSSECRSFLVRRYLDEVLLSLRPKLKKTNLEVVIECDEQLELRSYPGALAQILTNLVMNSLIHAYEPGQKGVLKIIVSEDGDDLKLRYEDDGKGMPPEHVSRVFDPFFTTKRGSGGSGLGMHIVFNLVHQQLGGAVMLQSKEGKGTTVDIVIPMHKEAHDEHPIENYG